MQGNGSGLVFTRTEQKILAILSDGMAHPRAEVLEALGDPEASLTAMQMHISNIRKKLERAGQTVVCENRGYCYFYRHVRLLHPDALD